MGPKSCRVFPMSRKITEANRADLIVPFHAEVRPVIVYPNPTGVCRSGPFVTSWLCEHAGPQQATEQDEIIACAICVYDLNAGAYVVEDIP